MPGCPSCRICAVEEDKGTLPPCYHRQTAPPPLKSKPNQNAYDNWPIRPFVLLIAYGRDPLLAGGRPGTDLYYATLEGHRYFNDVGIGGSRSMMPICQHDHKTLTYEQVG